MENENNPDEINFELGDKIHILGGRFNNTRGRIYYLDETLIRILPDGVSDRLVDLEIEDGYLKEEYEIENLFVVSKRINPAFVVQQDYNVGQMGEAFRGLEGTPVGKYGIVEVNVKEDIVVLKDFNNDIISLECRFRGIPLDSSIDVLRSREAPSVPLNENVEEETQEEKAIQGEDEEELDLGEEEFVEAPIIGQIQEIESALRNYPDNVQRSDMLQDLISKLDLKAQKSPQKIQDIRKLTELCLLLRNELVEYEKNGVPSGKKATSFDTLIDLVTNSNNSFSIPVLDVKRVLYLDTMNDEITTDLNVLPRNYSNQIIKENEFATTQFVGNQNVVSDDILPNWYIGWDRYNKDFFISWSSASKNNTYKFIQDKEFFRAPYPDDIDTPNVDGLPVVGLERIKGEILPVTFDYVGSILYSVLRGLKGRSKKLKDKEESRLIESNEEASVNSFLLFPKLYEREFGSTRSGKLAFDIGRSMDILKTISDILKEQNGISNIPSVGSIVAVGSSETFCGNIVIEDWLKNIPLLLHGLGDALVELKSYGFSQKEFSYGQQNVLIDKIKENIAHIKSHIQYIREKAEQDIKTIVFTNKNLLNPERTEEFIGILNSEPILQQYISILQKRLPFYRNNDVATFSGLHLYAQDLLYATLAGYPEALVKYRTQFVNKQFVESLQEAFLLNIKDESKLYEPEPNTCNHVNSYNTIKRVKDDSQRMQLLSKFLTQFQSYKKDNFIYCILCDKPCLCEHEYLLLQEFLYPREKETIHKELLLRFSGGVFQGKFICNNDGQPISELDFDTSLEYSDSGAPLIGRSELVDKDAIAQDEIDQRLGVPIGSIQELQFDTPAKTLYYQKARELFDHVGIFPDGDGYLFIVNGVDSTILRRPTREQYVAAEKTRIKQGQKAKSLDYDIYINRIMIGAILAYSIVEIQTHIPNYIPRYSTHGCVVDLRGFPLGKDTDKRIMEYISCVASNIVISKGDATNDPWRLSRFQDERTDKKRQDSILKFIEGIFKEILIYVDVQTKLSKKKEYLLSTFGKPEGTFIEGFEESIPQGFTPFFYIDIEEVIVPDAANEYEKVRGYILETHKEAKDTLKKELSPYAERTCCFQPIQYPLEFWNKKVLVKLPSKNVPRGPINSHSGFKFNLRKEDIPVFNVTKDDYYKLFLKVCYTGIHIGLPHEFDYNNICFYCGFKRSNESEDKENIERGSLEEQKIEINERSFQHLLDAVHKANSQKPNPKIIIENKNEIFKLLYDIQPAPFDRWRELLNTTIQELIKLPKDANDEDFANAYGEISSYTIESIEQIGGFIDDNEKATLLQILEQPLRQVIETLETSLLLPLSRIIKGYNLEQLNLPKSYNLDGSIVDDIKKFINLHTFYLENLKDKVTGFAKNKIIYAVSQLSIFISIFQNKIRSPLILGGKIGLPYILKGAIISILKDMCDPNVFNTEGDINDNTSRVPTMVLKSLLYKYRNERFKLTDEEIRIEIAKRDEKERMLIISKFDRLTKEEKAIELMQKRLGIGEWSVGGTKAIYTYNPEQYERDREQRIQMGFTGQGQGQGEDVQKDKFYEENAAYETHQTAEDDY